MQLCALPVCEDGGSSWVNIDSSDPDMVSGMSTVESIEVVSNVSSDGGRSQTRRSQTGRRVSEAAAGSASRPGSSHSVAAEAEVEQTRAQASSPALTPRGTFVKEDFDALQSLVAGLKDLDRQLAGSKRTSPAVSDKDEPRDQNAADGHWAHCAALDCSRLY